MSLFIKLFLRVTVISSLKTCLLADLVFDEIPSTEETEKDWSIFYNLSDQLINSLQNATENVYSFNTILDEIEDTTLLEEFTFNDEFHFTDLDENDESETELPLVSFNMYEDTIETNNINTNIEKYEQTLDVDQFTNEQLLVDELASINMITESITSILDITQGEEREVSYDSELFDVESDSAVTNREFDISTANEMEEFLSPEVEQYYFSEDESETTCFTMDQQITDHYENFDQVFEVPIKNYLEQRTSIKIQNVTDNFETTEMSVIKTLLSIKNISRSSTGTESSSIKHHVGKLSHNKVKNSLKVHKKPVISTTVHIESSSVTDESDDEIATEYDETEIPDYVEQEQTSSEDESSIIPKTNNNITTDVNGTESVSTYTSTTINWNNTEESTPKTSSSGHNDSKSTITSNKEMQSYAVIATEIPNKYHKTATTGTTDRKPFNQIGTRTTPKSKTKSTRSTKEHIQLKEKHYETSTKHTKNHQPVVAINIAIPANKKTTGNIGFETTNAISKETHTHKYAFTNEASNVTSLSDWQQNPFPEEIGTNNSHNSDTSTEQQWPFTEKNHRVSRAKQEVSTEIKHSSNTPTESSTVTSTIAISVSSIFTANTQEHSKNLSNATEEMIQSTTDLYDLLVESNTTLMIDNSSSSTGGTSPSNTSTELEEEDEVTESSTSITSRRNGSTTTEVTSTTQIVIEERAIKDIAYYLRAHKFNEYDRRYETKPELAPRSYFKEFPRPPLRSLHWEVRKFCEPSFYECVDYLRKRVSKAASKRVDDTVVVMQEQRWTMTNNSLQIKQVDEECKKMRKVDDIVADPFEGPLERFQWRSTASYYMCWYTMQQVPELEHFLENCDNFANCLDPQLGPNNGDERADDAQPYACALYSFCPDPCCADKHLARLERCWETPDNLCFDSNPAGQRQCSVNRSLNTDFRDLVLNRWNVTCRCPPSGREWNSLYGMCVDVDECTTGAHNCDKALEACVNLEGSFRCACKWGHIWDQKKKKCVPSAALGVIKLGRKAEGAAQNETLSFFKKMVRFFKGSNESNMLQPDSLMRTFVIAFVLTCTLNEFGLL